MLIFNKKDQFYSRVYNPHNKTIHEGVAIVPINEYDFDYIHSAAKTKFKKPRAAFSKFTSRSPWWMKNTTTKPSYTSSKSLMPSIQEEIDADKVIFGNHSKNSVDWDIINEILIASFDWYNPYSLEGQNSNREIELTKPVSIKLLEALGLYMDDRETIFFTYLLSQQAKKIPPIFTEGAFEKRFGSMNYVDNALEITNVYETELLNTSVSIDCLIDALQVTLDLADIQTKKACKEYLKENGYI
jgi:hypothetical protein